MSMEAGGRKYVDVKKKKNPKKKKSPGERKMKEINTIHFPRAVSQGELQNYLVVTGKVSGSHICRSRAICTARFTVMWRRMMW